MLPFNRIIAVALILLLIMAFVIVSVLNTSTAQVESFSDAQAVCAAAGQSSCDSAGALPVTWAMNTVDVNGTRFACGILRGCNSCSSCGFS